MSLPQVSMASLAFVVACHAVLSPDDEGVYAFLPTKSDGQ